MRPTLTKLHKQFPKLQFVAASQFCWSPETQQISYDASQRGPTAIWSLLHETGHALLGHSSYLADYQLIRLEMEAWQKARALAEGFGITIDENHIQDCLDSYRDWIYKRSICPTCHTKALQQGDYSHYRCHNCHTSWHVTTSRFARAYRSTKNTVGAPNTVFHLT